MERAALPYDKWKANEEKAKWAKAEAWMDGVKVRGDERRLKNASKREKKGKSKKAWYVLLTFSVPISHAV